MRLEDDFQEHDHDQRHRRLEMEDPLAFFVGFRNACLIMAGFIVFGLLLYRLLRLWLAG